MSAPHLNAAEKGARAAVSGDRQSRDDRQADLLRHAAREVMEQGGFPISFERLARAASVSKGLIYNYFPTQHVLGKALLVEELGRIDRARLRAASAQVDLVDAARDYADLYFDMICERGLLLHILLGDTYLERGEDRAIFGHAALILLPLVRRLRRGLNLSPRDANVVLQLLMTLPEEAGRKVFRKEADAALARRLCGETVEASLAALGGQTPAHIAEVAATADFL